MKERIFDTDGELLEAQYHKILVEIWESVEGSRRQPAYRGTIDQFNNTSVKVRNADGETGYFHREMCVIVEAPEPPQAARKQAAAPE